MSAASVAKSGLLDGVDALWRTLNWLCAALLYLRDVPLDGEPLRPEHCKVAPTGHWGTCPPVNFTLAHLAAAQRLLDDGGGERLELLPVIGPGHAGACQLALAWLTGILVRVRPEFPPTLEGLRRLLCEFPHVRGLGAEVTPLLGGIWQGGQLGGALAVAQGAVLDAQGRVAVPLVGDGECETGATAAAWLAARAVTGPGHGRVVPVVLANGQRMGGPSLLAGLHERQLVAYFAGLGWTADVDSGEDHARFHQLLTAALRDDGEAPNRLLVLTMPKGQTGPERLGCQQLLGSPRVHKTPLANPRGDPTEFTILARWLSGYRLGELLDHAAAPAKGLAAMLPAAAVLLEAPRSPPVLPHSSPHHHTARQAGFGPAVTNVLRAHAAPGGLRVFSPDELASNRLAELAGSPWAVEVLNEELCHLWLQGYVETGRRGLVVTYEAFSTIAASLAVQYLKYRRMADQDPARALPPSLNYLLTSLSWHNCYTHQHPDGLVGALLATCDPRVRVAAPADPTRAMAELDRMLVDHGHLNVLVASKHPLPVWSPATLEEELKRGAAVWPDISDEGAVELVTMSIGDLAARQVARALPVLRQEAGVRIRHVHVHQLTALGDRAVWPAGLPDEEFADLFGEALPLLIVTGGAPATIWGLLTSRARSRPVAVAGWREPPGPAGHGELLAWSGLDTAGLLARARRLLASTGLRSTSEWR